MSTAIYLRVSSPKGQKTDSQRAELEIWLKRHHYKSVQWFEDHLKGARDLCRSPDLMKKQCVVGSTQLQNRCLLRHRLFHLPVAYPRIDLASLIQTDPQRFWITGRLSSVYHRCHLLHRG